VELVDPASGGAEHRSLEGAGVGSLGMDGDGCVRRCPDGTVRYGFLIRFFPVRRADGTGFFDVRTIF
jgi:hypothetical protein